MADELTHCGRCGRKLRLKEFRYASNMPPMRRWLGHAAYKCSDDTGPSATAEQIRIAKQKLKDKK